MPIAFKRITGWLGTYSHQEFTEKTLHHRAPGQEQTPVSEGLNPPAPDLAHIASHRSLEEAFWVIKHGVRMTGMAAFGLSHEDAELWDLVAFIDQMKGASPAAYSQLMERARQSESDDDGHDHEHANSPDSSNENLGALRSLQQPRHRQRQDL